MALKRKFKSSKKKNVKRARRARAGSNKATRYSMRSVLGKGFPQKLTMSHVYQEYDSIAMNTGNAYLGTQVWRCNGLYDPNHTGVGHQPMFFDQMNALYDHWVVIGSKIEWTVTHASQSNGPVSVVCYIDDDTTTATNIGQAAEQFGAKVRTLPAGSPYNVKGTNKWSAKKYFGSGVLANNELQGTASADPTEQSYFVLKVQALNAADINVFFNVKITYIVVWKELKTIALS